jgi:Ca2+-binding EF-hand superfamily protein
MELSGGSIAETTYAKQAIKALMQLLQDDLRLRKVAKEVFDQLDIHNTGSIDFHEFSLMVNEFTQGLPEEKKPTHREIYLAFNKLDDDESGSLEFEEIRPFIKGIIQYMIVSFEKIV